MRTEFFDKDPMCIGSSNSMHCIIAAENRVKDNIRAMENIIQKLTPVEKVKESVQATYQNENFGDESNFRMDSKSKMDLKGVRKYF